MVCWWCFVGVAWACIECVVCKTHIHYITHAFTPSPSPLHTHTNTGTVSNVREATQWLSYTYMYRRMLINPLSYGIKWVDLQMDPSLETHRRTLVSEAARQLEKCRMARFDEASGNMYVTELGRVASHFYIRHSTIVEFNLQLRSNMTFDQVCFGGEVVVRGVYCDRCVVETCSPIYTHTPMHPHSHAPTPPCTHIPHTHT